MTKESEDELLQRLEALRKEHRELDTTIGELSHAVYTDQLKMRRLKKRKLWLKDLIARMESDLIPDIDA